MSNTKHSKLEVYSFSEEDINLITFALRRLQSATNFPNIAKDSKELIAYIERLKEENKNQYHSE